VRRLLPLAALLLAPGVASAQEPAAAAVDPARLAEARALVDVLMPPAERERMVEAMTAPVIANVRRAMAEDPSLSEMMGANPRAREMFDAFLQKQGASTEALMREALPGMIPAMANAYARRFDVGQLREIRAFFETPTGRTYARQAATIMSDPDVAAWQRRLMTSSMSRMREDLADLTRRVAALEPKR